MPHTIQKAGEQHTLALQQLIRHALDEDIRTGDITTDSIVPAGKYNEARWIAKDDGIIAGLFVGEAVFRQLDEDLEWNAVFDEGSRVDAGDVIVEMKGESRALLTGERTALNFAQRMCGIATAAHRYTGQLPGNGTQILDTRKTVPGLRVLDKYAVKTGGGKNHRAGLYDMVLIKENHIALAGGVSRAIAKARRSSPDVKIEVETTSLIEVQEAVESEADIIMLDNMSLEEMQQAIQVIDGRAKSEASGNVTLKKIKEIAATGVDYISVGALTHSVKAFDISQQILI